MGYIGRWLAAAAFAGAVTLAVAPAASAQKYGSLQFPRDEHQHVTGWDWGWGAAHVVTRSDRTSTAPLRNRWAVIGARRATLPSETFVLSGAQAEEIVRKRPMGARFGAAPANVVGGPVA